MTRVPSGVERMSPIACAKCALPDSGVPEDALMPAMPTTNHARGWGARRRQGKGRRYLFADLTGNADLTISGMAMRKSIAAVRLKAHLPSEP